MLGCYNVWNVGMIWQYNGIRESQRSYRSVVTGAGESLRGGSSSRKLGPSTSGTTSPELSIRGGWSQSIVVPERDVMIADSCK